MNDSKIRTSVMIDKSLKEKASAYNISLSFALEFGLRILLEDNVVKRIDRRNKNMENKLNSISVRLRNTEIEVIKHDTKLKELSSICEDLQKKVNMLLSNVDLKHTNKQTR